MKRIKKLISIIFLGVLCVFSCVSCKDDSLNYGYTRIESKESILKGYDTVDDMIKGVSTGTHYLFIGWTSCPWCAMYAPYFNNVLKDNKINTLDYFSPYDIKGYNETRSEDGSVVLSVDYKNSEYVKLLNWIDSEGDALEKGYLSINNIVTISGDFELPWFFAPKLYKVKDGKVIGCVGEIEGHIKTPTGSLPELTETQAKQLENSIKDLINVS